MGLSRKALLGTDLIGRMMAIFLKVNMVSSTTGRCGGLGQQQWQALSNEWPHGQESLGVNYRCPQESTLSGKHPQLNRRQTQRQMLGCDFWLSFGHWLSGSHGNTLCRPPTPGWIIHHKPLLLHLEIQHHFPPRPHFTQAAPSQWLSTVGRLITRLVPDMALSLPSILAEPTFACMAV